MVKATEKTRILYIITKSEPFGGAQKYVYDLATNLPSEFEAFVAFGSPIASGTSDSGGEELLKKKLKKHNIPTISIPHLARDISFIDEILVFFDLIKILKKHRPHVVHLNSSKIGGLGAFAVCVYNLPIHIRSLLGLRTTYYKLRTIFTAHGWPFKEERSWWQTALISMFSWITVFLSDTTIVVSEDDRMRASWMPFVQHKLHTVHNGSTPTKTVAKATARKFFKESGVPYNRGDIFIGMIGELTPNKGYRDAVRAMEILIREHPNTKLIIIGGGEEHEELKELIVMKELTEHIYLLGSVPDAAKYLHGVDLFLLSSHKEGLPYVLVEAGHASLPAVATAVGGVPEIVDDMRSGILIRPHNPQEIANALIFLLNNPEHQRAFGDALHAKVRGEFSFKKMLAKTLECYANIQI